MYDISVTLNNNINGATTSIVCIDQVIATCPPFDCEEPAEGCDMEIVYGANGCPINCEETCGCDNPDYAADHLEECTYCGD